jgi:hypothetical protein
MVVDVGVRPGIPATGEQRTPLRNSEDTDWLFVVNDRNTRVLARNVRELDDLTNGHIASS